MMQHLRSAPSLCLALRSGCSAWFRSVARVAMVCSGVVMLAGEGAFAQAPAAPAAPVQQTASPAPGPLPVANPGDQVVVKREALRVLDPNLYKVPLVLEPVASVPLVAPEDSFVRKISIKAGTAVQPQTEVVRVDNTAAQFRLARAQGLFKVATLEEAAASAAGSADIAKARLEAAKAELDLAQFQFDQSSVRAPFSGVIERVLVTEGQFVRAGEVLAICSDLSRMKVEIPAERALLDPTKSIPIKVEATDVEGKLESILPLAERFNPLRDLFDSVASAVVVLENPESKYRNGQTVYVPIIPRQAVAEVPSGSILNSEGGQRRVQVIRSNIVRDVPVSLMAGVGGSRLYVAGNFVAGDEVVYESSHQLEDGFQLKPPDGATPAAGAAPAANPGAVGF